MRPSLAATAAVAVTLATGVAVSGPATAGAGETQRLYADAAREHRVPQSVLLGVAYLESRWDVNAGRPSSSAGFGPMHLTDATALTTGQHHHTGGREDPRGDQARPGKPPREPAGRAAPGPALRTLNRAAELTGHSRESLRTDAAANIDGGAALLADYQKALGAPLSRDPADWYGAVARYSGATDTGSAGVFADEVYKVIATGARRVIDEGTEVRLPAVPDVEPEKGWLDRLDLREPRADGVECPASLACEMVPAPYRELDGGGYGNHDISNRPENQKVDYIVIHDTEGSYDTTLRLAQDPAYVSWHYTLRSQDGHIAQHVRTKDAAWHAGNWYVNAKAIGLEHEGFLAQGGSWYTEAMYRTSARLVRHLAAKYDIPLDRAHIIGHDNVPGPTPSAVAGMHEDPGPYWDWAHYFDLLGAPLRPTARAGAASVVILPDYRRNRPRYTGCDAADPAADCPPHGSSSVWLHTEPRGDAPLVRDVGKHPTGESPTSVYDHSARASTGQRYAVAERRGDWTAVWYLGQKAWFHNPQDNPAAVPARGRIVTPRPGLASVPVYGSAYPEPEAYPADVPAQKLEPLPYTFAAGQSYTVGLTTVGEYYRAVTFDTSRHVVVRGGRRYHQIQFGHRVMFVRADDVVVS